MSRLRVLVADDEPLALEMLRELVEQDAELEVVGSASDGSEAAEAIERLAPDIVLLDIEMPETSGLEAVRRLDAGQLPVFIFVTAYDRYATEAFEVEALDYVLKPVSDRRLSEALERAKRRVRERRLSGVAEQVATLTAWIERESSPRGERKIEDEHLRRLPVATSGRTRFVDVSEIIWIESEDYYVRLHTRRGRPLLRATLQSLEERLDPEPLLPGSPRGDRSAGPGRRDPDAPQGGPRAPALRRYPRAGQPVAMGEGPEHPGAEAQKTLTCALADDRARRRWHSSGGHAAQGEGSGSGLSAASVSLGRPRKIRSISAEVECSGSSWTSTTAPPRDSTSRRPTTSSMA